jgi:hypothetical protein
MVLGSFCLLEAVRKSEKVVGDTRVLSVPRRLSHSMSIALWSACNCLSHEA